MNMEVALNIAKRFITLPTAKRKLYLEKMYAENISPANLPVPPVQSLFDCIPLSFAQQRQWFLWQLNPDSPAYNIPTVLKLTGSLHIEALRLSFQHLIQRHESLRTTFGQDNEQSIQIIHPAQPFTLDIENLPAGQSVENWVEEQVRRPFDLELGPLLRVTLLALADDEHVLVVTLHHVISDGWSMPIMIDELIQLYEGFSLGQAVDLPALPIQYADYAIWQRNWMEAGEQERQLAYWLTKLGGEQPVLELPTDRARPSVVDQRGALLEISLGTELVKGLKAVAQRQGCTLFMVLLASFQSLLHRYSGQNDIRTGVPVANRTRVETEQLIGFFVNTQVLKAEFDLHTTFEQLLQQVRQTVLEAQTYQELPFEQLVEALQPDRSLSHNPLFQVMFNHQNQVKGTSREVQGLQVQGLSREGISAQFDLTLNTFEHEAGVGASLNYATALFDASTIERLGRHWLQLLEQVVRHPGQRIAELVLLDAEEHQQIVAQWNSTQVSYPAAQCLPQLLEQQVLKTPDAAALLFGEQSLKYAELNSRANRLAHKLRELGVGPDVLVGIAVERCVEMVVGLLGVLKAGGTYVPLDPEYPQERLAYMLEHSGAQLLLTQERLLDQLPSTTINTWCLDRDWSQLADYPSDNLDVAVHPEHTAYCIYTSGSTGKPKGVAVRHQALVNFLFSMAQQPGLEASDRVLALTSLSFDIAGLELYLPLLVGASVVLLADRKNQDPQALLRLIERQAVTTVQATPSTWRMLLDAAGPEALRNCRLLSGGEALAPDLANRLLERSEQVWNLYGPTETTIWSGLHCLKRESPTPLLGKPIANTTLHIVEQSLATAPIGVAGELLIGGDGLARGYLHRPDLTAERFVPNPFDTSEQGGGRLYRTGDLARYLADGVIEYISRIDHQVKIRGFRIELGEIEAKLLEHEAVREAVVIDVDGASGQQLAAYLVSTSTLDEEQQLQLRTALREQLRDSLPDYMVPSYLLFLDQLPLTPNGKLDRKALPKPDASQRQQVYVAPQSELERQIATIWAQVLKVEQVGLTDNFFELGGHSLLATQVISRVRQVLGIELPLRILFEAAVLGEFVGKLTDSSASQAPAFEKVDRSQPLVLSFAQQRQWFLWQLEPDSAAYNMPVALRFRGALDQQALRSSFDALIARHETLRTTFRQEGEQAVQIIHAQQSATIDIERLDSEAAIQTRVEEEILRPFDLIHGPLLRVKLLRLSDEDHVLALTMHHIVSDGWSMPVMVEELISLYEGYRQRDAVDLPSLPIQYADYAVWQRNWMEAGEQARQLAYWTEQLGGEQPVLELPLDRPRPSMQSHSGASLELDVSVELAGSLKQLARQQGVTLFMVLLASFQSVLHRHSGQADIRVGVPNANRNQAETERLIGFFVNTQVLKAEFDLGTTFIALLQQIKGAALGAQAHQDLPFEQLVEALKVERSFSHTPLFQVMFNHQTEVKEASRALPGLQVESLDWAEQLAKFDLTLNTFEHESGIVASLNYATALFDASTIERLGRHWLQLLNQVVRHPGQRIAELALLDAEEHQQIVAQWNCTQVSYPTAQNLPQLIEKQVLKTPNAAALLFGEQSLSYTELNSRANRLAHKLRELGVGPDVLVGIAVERSVEMVVGLLGILKAGGAYVPLDPEYPQERMAYMLEHSGAQLLLTQERLLEQLPATGITTWCLDRDWQQLAGYSSDNLGVTLHPDHTAYCIYTSGSTGKPKGVAVRHQALVNFLFSMAQQPGLTADDRVLALTSLSFDIAGLELYLPLLVGASVVLLADRENQDPQALLRLIEQQSVTTVQATPSTWRMLLDAAGPEALRNCRLLSGGEALAPDLANRLLERSEQVWNLYGPTETTIWSGLHCLKRESPTPLLGKPIANTTLHIVEQSLATAPIGVAGELLIGGDGLARGYLHRPDLTAERFVPNPFDTSEQGGGRLYRTGDLARYLADGVIEYISRIDHQVKIRGFRIELGEIEAKLLEHEAVREAVVIDIEGPNSRQLAAYVVPIDQTVMNNEKNFEFGKFLRDYLSSVLAAYMVPAYVVVLDKLPMTPNGKLDRKSLVKPEISLAERKIVLPRTRLERQLSAVWCEVLRRTDVGLHDEFFELGGSSLLLLSALKKVQEQIDSRMTIHDFMQNLSIYKQAEFLRGGLVSKGGSLVKLNSYEGMQTAIFCLPPAGGTTFPYSSLAKALSEVCPVYALLHKGFVEKGFRYESWDEMVRHYHAEIIMSQAAGPYKLLGWSSGGALAMEVAHLLENAGEEVELLALVDPMLPQHIVEHHHAKDDGASSTVVDLAGVNERNQAAVMMVRSFFSEKSDEDIMVLVREGRALGFQDDKLVEFLIENLVSERGGDVDALKAIYDAYAMEAEFAVGYDTYGNVADLIRDFKFRAVKAKPDIWWSSMFYKDIGLLESKLVSECVVSGLGSVEMVNVSHERIIYVSEFLSDLRWRLENTSDRLGDDAVQVPPVLNSDG